jgi:uncharacterized protein
MRSGKRVTVLEIGGSIKTPMNPHPDADQARGSVVASPCRAICVMGRDGYCTGCARTLEEIGTWMMLSTAERLRVWEKLAARNPALMSDNPR